MRESSRRKAITVLAYGSWLGALGMTAVLTYFNFTHPLPALPNAFQRVGGLFIVLLIGVAISSGLALSRIRLAKTLSAVFEEGYRASEKRKNNREH